jgi:hypothetical protein
MDVPRRAVIVESDVPIYVYRDGTWHYVGESKPEPEPKYKRKQRPNPEGPRLCDHECCAEPFEDTHRHLFDPADCPLCQWKDYVDDDDVR